MDNDSQSKNSNSINKNQTWDLSGGKFYIKLSIFHLISIIIFIGGIIWFLAASWVFDIKCTEKINSISDKLKNDLINEFGLIQKNISN